MPRTLPCIVGCLLAMAVVGPASSASAQWLGLFRRQQTTVRNGRYELSGILSDEHQRLTEMQVELALLADIATFPYDLRAHANGNAFELSGNVPNDVVRRRAMDLARRTTVLRGIDALRIQPKLSVQSILRPQSAVLQDGFELLRQELRGQAEQMALEVRPNGVVVLAGRIDSVESKLEISKLFRRLPGCTAVINELIVEPVLLDGQRMVRIMRNNMLFLPPSTLGQDQEALPADNSASIPVKNTPRSADPQHIASPQLKPAVLPTIPPGTSHLDARKGELDLPDASSIKQRSTPAQHAPEKVGGDWEAFAPSKLPVKWGRPTGSWQAQAKDLAELNAKSKEKPSQTTRRQTPQSAQMGSKPAEVVWMPQASQPQAKLPTPIRSVSGPDATNRARSVSTSIKNSRADSRSSTKFAEIHETPEPVMTWRRPGGSEESEPNSPVPAQAPNDAAQTPPSPPAAGTSRQSSRRWPPAYVTGPPPSKGRPGVIVFEEDAPTPPKPMPAVIATTRPIAAAELQRRIKSLCGGQASEIVAAAQHDGSVLVRIKVANRSIEDQLARKILALPEMNSPRVRLMMEIQP